MSKRHATADVPKIANSDDADVNQDTAADPADESQETGSGKMSMMDMVVEAIEDGHSEPKTGMPYLDKKYPGHGIKPQYYSVCKTNYLKKQNRTNTNGTTTTSKLHGTITHTVPETFGKDVDVLVDLMEKVGGADALLQIANDLGDLLDRYKVGGLNTMIKAFGRLQK